MCVGVCVCTGEQVVEVRLEVEVEVEGASNAGARTGLWLYEFDGRLRRVQGVQLYAPVWDLRSLWSPPGVWEGARERGC